MPMSDADLRATLARAPPWTEPCRKRGQALVCREGLHDDLVLATALACWWGERQPLQQQRAFKVKLCQIPLDTLA